MSAEQTANSFYLLTQGCKINQYESQALAECWQDQGAQEVSSAREADVIVLNTCAVTGKAVQDVRKAVRRCRRANSRARILVTGCAAQVCAQELSALPEVDMLVPQEQKEDLTAWPSTAWPRSLPVDRPNTSTVYPFFSIQRFPRARPVIKVQDGCSHRCSYCIVPLSRGPSRSRDPELVVQEAQRLLDHGYRELVVSGINLSQYRSSGMDFWDLILLMQDRLAREWGDVARLRLSSLDPVQLTPKALQVLRASGMICPHLHVSMQSASPEVLQDMGRSHYHPEEVGEFFQKLDDLWPTYALGLDLLTGFPGESDADMLRTEEWLQSQPLTYAHVFPYSPRPGTAASQRRDHIPEAVKKERSQRLRDLARTKNEAFVQRIAAKPRISVLLEDGHPAQGQSEHYVTCLFEREPQAALRTCVPAKPVRTEGRTLWVQEVQ